MITFLSHIAHHQRYKHEDASDGHAAAEHFTGKGYGEECAEHGFRGHEDGDVMGGNDFLAYGLNHEGENRVETMRKS